MTNSYQDDDQLTAGQRWAADCFGALPGLRTECTSGGPYAHPDPSLLHGRGSTCLAGVGVVS